MASYIKFGQNQFSLETLKFHLWVKGEGNYDWTFEIYPIGTEDYLMLNSLSLNGAITTNQLAGKKFTLSDDLTEVSLQIDGSIRFLENMTLEFGQTSLNGRLIFLRGTGEVAKGDTKAEPAITCEFAGDATWEYITAIGRTEEEAFEHIGKLFDKPATAFDIEYRSVHDGFSCSALPKTV